jgi:putative phosphoribosyl transferase
LATLRVDLLSSAEDALYEDRLNLNLLSDRLANAAGWLKGQPALDDLRVGLLGVGTSGTSVLELAASLRQEVAAVVLWEGRPDLVQHLLPYVTAPTLLIVGGQDSLVLRHNQDAYAALRGVKEFLVIPGATHRFVEPGAVRAVVERAGGWFSNHLSAVSCP